MITYRGKGVMWHIWRDIKDMLPYIPFIIVIALLGGEEYVVWSAVYVAIIVAIRRIRNDQNI